MEDHHHQRVGLGAVKGKQGRVSLDRRSLVW
jgi:hypothetical protein